MTGTAPILYFVPATCLRVMLTELEEINQPFETKLVAFVPHNVKK